jgi:hypothetical protein
MRWLWLARTDPERLWSSLPVKIFYKVKAFFSIDMVTKIGNSASTFFWKDQWLHRKCIQDLAPRLFVVVPRRIVNNRKVQQALVDRSWIHDIQGALTVGVIADFLTLREALRVVELQPLMEDKHIFRFPDNDNYSTKQLMRVYLLAQLILNLVRKYGSLGLHQNVKFSCGLLPSKGAGQKASYKNEGFSILVVALFVTRNRKQLTICWQIAFLQDNSGSDFLGKSTGLTP